MSSGSSTRPTGRWRRSGSPRSCARRSSATGSRRPPPSTGSGPCRWARRASPSRPRRRTASEAFAGRARDHRPHQGGGPDLEEGGRRGRRALGRGRRGRRRWASRLSDERAARAALRRAAASDRAAAQPPRPADSRTLAVDGGPRAASSAAASELRARQRQRARIARSSQRRGAAELERRATPSLRPVINATGVVVHTNLGRAPLPLDALDALEARRQRLLEPGVRRSSAARAAAGTRTWRSCSRAHRRRGRARGQQQRGRRVAAVAALARGREVVDLARAAGRDRRLVPDPGDPRRLGRAAGRGRDHQPHALCRLRARDRPRHRGADARASRPTSAPSASRRSRR